MPEGTENKTEEEPTMKNNTFFEELNQIACTFEKAHEEHKALKRQIIDEKGWDSEELKAWYKEEEENFQYPISAGASKAYRAWRYSETDEVIMDDFTWDRERHDFIDTLRKAVSRPGGHQPVHRPDGRPCTATAAEVHDAGALHHHEEEQPLGQKRPRSRSWASAES